MNNDNKVKEVKSDKVIVKQNTPKIYESPDKGKTIYERNFGDYTNRKQIK